MDFRSKFIDSVIKGFEYNERNKDQQGDFIISLYLFEELKPRMLVEILFCELNKKRVSTFRKKFNYFTNDSYDLNVVWKTKKVRSFFLLKDTNLDPSYKIYYGLCSFGEDYVGTTKRNVSVRCDEHNSPLISQNQLHTLNITMTIISLGGFYAMNHEMVEHVRISRRFL